jgi:hypothetical protein
VKIRGDSSQLIADLIVFFPADHADRVKIRVDSSQLIVDWSFPLGVNH